MRAGRRSTSTRSSVGQSGPWGPLLKAVRGWAVRVSVSPLAMPILLCPKSSATMSWGPPSGMTGERGELAGLDAEQPERCEPALLVGQVEDHALVRRDA